MLKPLEHFKTTILEFLMHFKYIFIYYFTKVQLVSVGFEYKLTSAYLTVLVLSKLK